jgi:hypothetical protein
MIAQGGGVGDILADEDVMRLLKANETNYCGIMPNQNNSSGIGCHHEKSHQVRRRVARTAIPNTI